MVPTPDSSTGADNLQPVGAVAGWKLAYIRSMLRSRLAVTNVDHHRYPAGHRSDDEIITSNRYILIQDGRMDYEIEGVKTRLEAGALFFVPAWVRRCWRSVRGQGCEIFWCEFSSYSLETGQHALFRAENVDTGLERESLRRMRELWCAAGRRPSYFPDTGRSFMAEHAEDLVALRLEGELKSALSRFWVNAVRDTDDGRADERHPEIRRAITIMEENFHRPDALECFYDRVTLSENHIRILFKKQMKTSPRDYLNGIRMRHARHLIHHSERAVKDIAYSVGFRDPLHFSKQYHAFWGHFPSKDRHAGKDGVTR